MVNERMQQLINAVSNGNKRAFSQLVGVTPTVIENIVGTRKGKPGYELLEKIAFAIENINMDWVLTGRGSMLCTDSIQHPVESVSASTSSDAVVLRLMDKLDDKETENKQLQSELRQKSEELAVLKSKYKPQPESLKRASKSSEPAKPAFTKQPSSPTADNATSAIVP